MEVDEFVRGDLSSPDDDILGTDLKDEAPEVTFEGGARPLLVGLLAVQIILGYEWLMSGVSKLLAGDFVTGLADHLTNQSKDLSGWYRSFLEGVVIPNGQLFASVVMFGELLVGVVLIGTALQWLTRWSSLNRGARQLLLSLVVLAGLAATVMSVNFHLASGSTQPWLIATDPFDQGVDLDSVMAIIQIVIAAVAFVFLRRVRARRSGSARHS